MNFGIVRCMWRAFKNNWKELFFFHSFAFCFACSLRCFSVWFLFLCLCRRFLFLFSAWASKIQWRTVCLLACLPANLLKSKCLEYYWLVDCLVGWFILFASSHKRCNNAMIHTRNIQSHNWEAHCLYMRKNTDSHKVYVQHVCGGLKKYTKRWDLKHSSNICVHVFVLTNETRTNAHQRCNSTM